MANAIISGKLRYAKILGEPRDKYQSTDKEWSFELTAEGDTKKILKDFKAKNRFKVVEDMDEYYPEPPKKVETTKFQRDAVRSDGSAANPYKIVDEYGDPWPQDKLLGNGTAVTVLVKFYPRTSPDGEKFNKAEAIEIMVTNHIPYEGGGGTLEYKAKEKTEEWTE